VWREAAALAGAGAALVAASMVFAWLLHLRLRDAGVVDVFWAANLAALSLWYALAGSGLPLRRGLAAAMSLAWGARLAVHIARRLRGQPEEGRYRQLRRDWGGNIAAKFLGFFLFQGALDLFLSIPFLAACLNRAPAIAPVEWAGVALWGVALLGETVADRQLERFKARPENRGRTCREGLWRTSRHPNYFFEWSVWVAWALFASASPGGLLAWACPALMLYFLLRVTGIPATEAQALRTRGEDYRDYQRTTSAFVPWFPRRPREPDVESRRRAS
jgi:steroid 5-alpha reductase family enzyme